MSTLNRNTLEDGSYAGTLELPPHLLWSNAQLDESLANSLKDRPDGDVWIFAYGSLMWNPLLDVAERRNAVLHGWHRSFCLRAVAGRGSSRQPGRMLALEPGGTVQGAALRLSEETATSELRLLWSREMVAGSYEPRWEPVILSDGRSVRALVFVIDARGELYEPGAEPADVAPLIARARGALGTNAEYVCHLDFALADAGLCDPYVSALVSELKGDRNSQR